MSSKSSSKSLMKHTLQSPALTIDHDKFDKQNDDILLLKKSSKVHHRQERLPSVQFSTI